MILLKVGMSAPYELKLILIVLSVKSLYGEILHNYRLNGV